MKKEKIIKILVQGYAREINNEEFASSTAVLIKDGNLKLVVDPGMDREALLKGLEDEGITPDDIDFVIVTHTHLDHSLLAGIFNKAVILDNDTIYNFNGKIGEHDGRVPDTDIEIIKTTGHDQFHCSVFLNTKEYGEVIIAGDVFWWEDNEEQKIDRQSLLEHKDPYVKEEQALRESRKKVLSMADYIIPGHGKMFKVEK